MEKILNKILELSQKVISPIITTVIGGLFGLLFNLTNITAFKYIALVILIHPLIIVGIFIFSGFRNTIKDFKEK